MLAPKLSELKSMSDEDLVSKFDEHAHSTVVGIGFLIDEIRSRQMTAINSSMLSLTRWVFIFTVVVTLATVVNVALFWFDLFVSTETAQ